MYRTRQPYMHDRRAAATSRVFDAIGPLVGEASVEELERLAGRLEESTYPLDFGDDEDLIAALTEGRTYSYSERMALELENQARYFEDRRALLQDALTASEAAALLGTSRQTPHDRVKAGTMLAVSERGHLMFPRWQFDVDGPNGVVKDLAAVIRELHVSDIAKVRWLTRSNPTLGGQAPIDALKNGDEQRVVDAARAVGVS